MSKPTMSTSQDADQNFRIDSDTAKLYISNWQDTTNDYSLVPSSVTPSGSQLQLDSFVFSIEDFTRFVDRVNTYNISSSNNPITGVVCKIGVKPTPFSDGTRPNVPCLIFEPLTAFKTTAYESVSKDNVNAGTDVGDIADGTNPNTNSARYDFSFPCPPTCSLPTN
ncbi:MAG: hypothetical protein Q8M29_17635 [Bacteroidota bacterium]|nr:hypothetical protein [Bacteroidota bacterium]